MRLFKRIFRNVFIFKLFFIALVFSGAVSPEEIEQATDANDNPTHKRVNQFYSNKTEADDACTARAAELGYGAGYCNNGSTPRGALVEHFYSAGWLCSGGPPVGGVCSQMPFYLLVYYYGVVCDDGKSLNEKSGCADPNRAKPKPPEPCQNGKSESPKKLESIATKNPVNIATGSKFFQITDYQHQNHPLLRLARTYDSSDGRWHFNFSSSVFIQAGRMRVIEDSGRSISFREVSGTWVTENGGNYSLESVNGLWVYKNGSTTKYYDSQNRLVTIESPQYEDINITYPTTGAAVISSLSASISVTYQDHLSHVLSASLPDGTTITYSYDVQDRLVQVDNRGQTEDYLYENPAFPTAITSVLGGDGNVYKEITYYPDGRVHTSSLVNGDEVSTFTYPQENVTSVVNALGKETIYSFEEFWGEKKIAQVDGVATPNCTAANKNFTYYPNGLLETKTDWQGSTTSYQYDTRNLEISRTEAVGTPQERTITTEWHPTFNLRTKVTMPGRETVFNYDAQGRLLSQINNALPLN